MLLLILLKLNSIRLGTSLQFEEGIEKTVKWYLENKKWMDNVTSGDYQDYYWKCIISHSFFIT